MKKLTPRKYKDIDFFRLSDITKDNDELLYIISMSKDGKFPKIYYLSSCIMGYRALTNEDETKLQYIKYSLEKNSLPVTLFNELRLKRTLKGYHPLSQSNLFQIFKNKTSYVTCYSRDLHQEASRENPSSDKISDPSYYNLERNLLILEHSPRKLFFPTDIKDLWLGDLFVSTKEYFKSKPSLERKNRREEIYKLAAQIIAKAYLLNKRTPMINEKGKINLSELERRISKQIQVNYPQGDTPRGLSQDSIYKAIQQMMTEAPLD